MTISEERLNVLNLIQAGKITPQEGMSLLEDLNKLEASRSQLDESLKKVKEDIKDTVRDGIKASENSSGKSDDARTAWKAELRASVEQARADARKAVEDAHRHKAEAAEFHESLAQIAGKGPRYFHLHVTDTRTGKSRVDVRMPVGVITAGVKMGAHFSPEIEGMDTNHLIEMINEGDMGKVMDVVDEDDCEHVEVFLE